MDNKFLSPVTVRDIVKARGTRFATVTFVKADGSLRVANGLFRPSKHIVGSERGIRQGEMFKKQGIVPFYDLKKGSWISFREDKVVEVV